MKLRDFIGHIKHNSVFLNVFDLDRDIIFNGTIGEIKHNINALRYYDYKIYSIDVYGDNEFDLYIEEVKYKDD